ncbi:hypothetical protein A2533_00720 [Candidatus Falkowbacteria bacterium RIFOXYD2_FULL_35_9]|uniref:Uncharacterized protein n=1 Tax=Candidatus Falkowbacteria bacterium RIFOXYC2_FULL_36_12 TaxID=1798002 RepID=A0A1F5T3N1_9BACT|nr:MAG: hypothetical protein A2300_04340 [Candidatus Falkowbacteria bacterium RIFOXYB2_FULL_35_7]OGF33353.1 MAG: hypothetical protein A2478_01475 [Candidatus Falkowbacteria bacterium RIFOXYC2_FULL_36_12]OGF45598.1 MAG: hypothetical protein A2533_00720 [Candidatus Falkowbacteria bacterium RIFOXYD2_FULL_35_9]
MTNQEKLNYISKFKFYSVGGRWIARLLESIVLLFLMLFLFVWYNILTLIPIIIYVAWQVFIIFKLHRYDLSTITEIKIGNEETPAGDHLWYFANKRRNISFYLTLPDSALTKYFHSLTNYNVIRLPLSNSYNFQKEVNFSSGHKFWVAFTYLIHVDISYQIVKNLLDIGRTPLQIQEYYRSRLQGFCDVFQTAPFSVPVTPVFSELPVFHAWVTETVAYTRKMWQDINLGLSLGSVNYTVKSESRHQVD